MPVKSRATAKRAGKGARVAIVRARWNEDVTRALERGAIERAAANGATADVFEVAGSFELPGAIAMLADTGRYDAIVPLGCLIRGETPHFDVLAHTVARSIADLAATYPIAITFGLLTCNTIEQAMERAGGVGGNAGAEAMDAALEMVTLRQAVAIRSRSASARSKARSRSTR
jgi:6,7-dimethyl-8-ribityllumazine synthase